jgi:hypothetical protein
VVLHCLRCRFVDLGSIEPESNAAKAEPEKERASFT